jgi:hypothetical protein
MARVVGGDERAGRAGVRSAVQRDGAQAHSGDGIQRRADDDQHQRGQIDKSIASRDGSHVDAPNVIARHAAVTG